jgi:hypothetical protein
MTNKPMTDFEIKWPGLASYCRKKELDFSPQKHKLLDLLEEIVKDLDSVKSKTVFIPLEWVEQILSTSMVCWNEGQGSPTDVLEWIVVNYPSYDKTCRMMIDG